MRLLVLGMCLQQVDTTKKSFGLEKRFAMPLEIYNTEAVETVPPQLKSVDCVDSPDEGSQPT